jgi:ankyrin repeat protein
MAKPEFKTSALMAAIRNRNLDAVLRALDDGAEVDESDIHGHPGLPLRTACFEGETAIVAELIRRGANVNAPGSDGHGMPIRLAARAGHRAIIDLLVANGAEIPHGVLIDFAPPEALAPATPQPPEETAPSSLDIPLLDELTTSQLSLSPRQEYPLIEEVDAQGCYGVDTNVLNQDLLRLVDDPEPRTSSRRSRDV